MRQPLVVVRGSWGVYVGVYAIRVYCAGWGGSTPYAVVVGVYREARVHYRQCSTGLSKLSLTERWVDLGRSSNRSLSELT